MKSSAAFALLVLLVVGGFYAMIDRSPVVEDPDVQPVSEIFVLSALASPNLQRDPSTALSAANSDSTSFTTPNEATLRWREDASLIKSMQDEFNRTIAQKIAATMGDAEQRRFGERSIRSALAVSGLTMPALQFREEDFTSLTEDQKNNLGKHLSAIALTESEKGNTIPVSLSGEDLDSYLSTVLNRSIYYPPELVLEAQGLREKLKNPDFASQVRALRVRIYNQAAPVLADLYNTTRFACGAIMNYGVDPTTLEFEEDAALITPMVHEYRLRLAALSEEFVLGCEEIGRRFP